MIKKCIYRKLEGVILESSNNNLKCNALQKKEWLQAGTANKVCKSNKIISSKVPSWGHFGKVSLKG